MATASAMFSNTVLVIKSLIGEEITKIDKVLVVVNAVVLMGSSLVNAAIEAASIYDKFKGQSKGAEVKGTGNDGYTPPEGGGGISDSFQIGDNTINFGHGGRHLEGIDLSVNDVNNILAKDVLTRSLTPGISNEFTIVINGIEVTYRAFAVSENIINIGTYFVR